MSGGTGLPKSRQRYSIRFRDSAEQRLEEQMLEQVVAPDVEHERDRGADERDVREVLVRSDADVYAAVRADLRELARDCGDTTTRSR